jgi:hypothetical protein
MLNSHRLLAPALIPSWRFFDRITASPRIEVARLTAADATPGDWLEFRPRPQSLSPGTLLCRLVWNPRWNETLFLTSCAERLLETPTGHSVAEISTRIAATLDAGTAPFFRFRLVLVSRAGDALRQEVAYVSPCQAVAPR